MFTKSAYHNILKSLYYDTRLSYKGYILIDEILDEHVMETIMNVLGDRRLTSISQSDIRSAIETMYPSNVDSIHSSCTYIVKKYESYLSKYRMKQRVIKDHMLGLRLSFKKTARIVRKVMGISIEVPTSIYLTRYLEYHAARIFNIAGVHMYAQKRKTLKDTDIILALREINDRHIPTDDYD